MAKTRRRKKRTHVPQYTDPAKKSDPKTFVFWRGKHGRIMKSLEGDLRRVMQPNTAENLRESNRNHLRDFVDIAGPLGVSHFLILTATANAAYLRLVKTPRGPTLTMRIHEYALMKDVTATLLRPRQPDSMWKAPPLVVMNNFAGRPELKLATALFQNLFPAINVQTAKLSTCQRVVLLSFDKDTGRISFRHFGISAAPSGVTRSVKQLVNRRQLPNMGALGDVSELLTKSGYGSESEGEEAAEARVALPQDMGRGNLAARQSRVRLQEIGPRMELEVVKAEEGMCEGRVLFHSHVHKSAEESVAQQEEVDERDRLKAERRRQQAENVARKQVLKKRKPAAQEGDEAGGEQKKKRMWWEDELDGQRRSARDGPEENAAYFREEVGQEPEDMPGAYGGSQSGGRGSFRGGSRGRSRGDGHSSRGRSPGRGARGGPAAAQDGGRGRGFDRGPRGGGREGGFRGRGRGREGGFGGRGSFQGRSSARGRSSPGRSSRGRGRR
ncbi:hypothetical protein CVIRNUC_001009 [Coccomyxa viridis]|uniref:Brix domain-containing protein n=1 Tax=Coccomyxa viridis TaxID=1274662 RepID=A0AAV1HSP6_9CHLO|nr:hypothetical protein CVIRNUC_001009 [Coccomyxa viridis]